MLLQPQSRAPSHTCIQRFYAAVTVFRIQFRLVNKCRFSLWPEIGSNSTITSLAFYRLLCGQRANLARTGRTACLLRGLYVLGSDLQKKEFRKLGKNLG